MKRTKNFKSILVVFALLLIAAAVMFGLTISPNMNQTALAVSAEESEDAFPNVTIDPIPDYIDDGKLPDPKVVVRDGDKILVKGEDYYTQISLVGGTSFAGYYEYVVNVYGKNEYVGLFKSTYFYKFIPEPHFIHIELDVPKDKEFANDEEWSTFVENNLSLTFSLKDHKIALSEWVIRKSYIDTKNAYRLSDGTVHGVHGVVEICVKEVVVYENYPSSYEYKGGDYTILQEYSINYTSPLALPEDFYADKNYYTFPIIMSCLILGAVFVSAVVYYIINAIRKKKNTKKD